MGTGLVTWTRFGARFGYGSLLVIRVWAQVKFRPDQSQPISILLCVVEAEVGQGEMGEFHVEKAEEFQVGKLCFVNKDSKWGRYESFK